MGKMTVAEVMLRTLAQAGVDTIFGFPGSTNLALFDALSRVESIRLILVRHEQGAAHMADGYARAAGKPAACLVSRGPGATNLLIGLHNAYQESVPVIALIGQVDSDILYRDAFEEIDLMTLLKPVTKFGAEIFWPQRAEELIKRAVQYATSGRPRPVMVSVPGDIQGKLIEWSAEKNSVLRFVRPQLPSSEEVAQTMKLLLNSAHPVFLAGGGIKQSGAVPELVRLAEWVGAGVVTAWMRNDAFPNSHPLYLGMLGTGHRSAEATKRAVKESDLVMAVGCRFSENTTNRYTMSFEGKKLIHIDIDPLEIGKIYQPDIGICADAKKALRTLTAEWQVNNRSLQGDRHRCIAWVKALREEYLHQIELPPKFSSQKMHPGEIVRAMRTVLPEDSIIVSDSGAFVYFVIRYYSFNFAGTFIAPAGGAMGFGLPAAIGVKLAQPEKTVICVSGDGGFLMTVQEIETAVRYGINVISIVFNNYELGNVVSKQKKEYEGRCTGSKFGNPDFCMLAQSFGAHGERVKNPENMGRALKSAIHAHKPAVIDVQVDPDVILP